MGNPYVPAVDASFSSPEPGAAAGLLLSRFPLWPITNETLESKGSPETIGLWRLFCPLFQLLGKVGRRRHVLAEVTRRSQQRQRASQAVKGYRHKYSLSLPRVLRTRGNPFHTVEHQASSTDRVAAARVDGSRFLASTGPMMQLLHTIEEALKP